MRDAIGSTHGHRDDPCTRNEHEGHPDDRTRLARHLEDARRIAAKEAGRRQRESNSNNGDLLSW